MLLLPLLVSCAAIVIGCGNAAMTAFDPDDLPLAPLPDALTGIMLPTDPDGFTRALGGLPDEIAGRARLGDANAQPYRAGRDGQVTWLHKRSTDNVFMFGADNSAWLVIAEAPTGEQLNALLIAFFTSVMGEPPACAQFATPRCGGL